MTRPISAVRAMGTVLIRFVFWVDQERGEQGWLIGFRQSECSQCLGGEGRRKNGWLVLIDVRGSTTFVAAGELAGFSGEHGLVICSDFSERRRVA